MTANKKFIVTKNREIIEKLCAVNILPWCCNDDEEQYFVNCDEVLSYLSDEDKRHIAFSSMIMG